MNKDTIILVLKVGIKNLSFLEVEKLLKMKLVT